jgi:CheY-like chemotaxis protein
MANILVVDDDESLLQMMSLMLKRGGHTPILARDGQEGINIARRQQPDLAIIDVMMPDINGYDVCRALRSDPATANIPLLVLTALSQPEQRDLARESGADDFITKPVTRDDLTKHVSALLTTSLRNIPVHPVSAPPPPSAAQAPPPVARPAPPPSEATPQPADQLPFVAVMGLRPGVGATTLAVNLGVALNQFGRACIFDLSPLGGQIAIHLKMTPPQVTWEALRGIAPGSDKRLIADALMLEPQSGVAVLAAPIQPAQHYFNEISLKYLFSVLGEGFHYTVIDLPSSPNPMTLAALRAAQHVVLVVDNDPSKLVQAPPVLTSILQVGISGHVHIVMSHTRPHGVSSEDIIHALNSPLAANIPYDPTQTQTLTHGYPLTISAPDSLFARTVVQFARMLL